MSRLANHDVEMIYTRIATATLCSGVHSPFPLFVQSGFASHKVPMPAPDVFGGGGAYSPFQLLSHLNDEESKGQRI